MFGTKNYSSLMQTGKGHDEVEEEDTDSDGDDGDVDRRRKKSDIYVPPKMVPKFYGW